MKKLQSIEIMQKGELHSNNITMRW